MGTFDYEKEFICSMLEANNYGVRNGDMPGDDFRLFLRPPGFEVESEEVFKIKGIENVCCGAVILLGGKIRKNLYEQSKERRDGFRKTIENADGVRHLDFFEIDDDGKDFKISIRAEFPIGKLSEDTFADAIDRLNLAGGAIEDTINSYFDNAMRNQT